jgi:UDP-glucose 4-epimerase
MGSAYMKILVTGSEGFIGKNLCERLEQQGHEVVRYDEKIDRPTESYWVAEEDFEVCFHLACMNQMNAVKNWQENMEVNALDTRLMALESAKRGAKFVYTSTASVYGNARTIPTPSTADLNPLTDYAVAKLAGEYFVKNSGADWTILRLSNVYGPHQTLDNPYCGVIGRFMEQARKGEPLTVIGSGMQTRDFTYVGDVVKNLILVGIDWQNVYSEQVLNISHGRETTVMEIAERVLDLYDREDLKKIPERAIDSVARRCLIPDLHYCPTGISKGLSLTKDWFDNKVV